MRGFETTNEYRKSTVLSRLSVNGTACHAKWWMGSGKPLVLTEARPLLLGCYKPDSDLGWAVDEL